MADAKADDKPEPVLDPANFGKTAYGPLRGELRSMYMDDPSAIQDFQDRHTPLEKAVWYNYSLRDEMPPFISASYDDNRRLWQELNFEQMLDHQPPHEMHPADLPDYHFWPRIQDELNAPPKVITDANREHVQVASDIPRFYRPGTPKTPLQEQDWYLPLTKEGRFDWRKNIQKNGYSGSILDAKGWERRYLLAANTDMMPFHTQGARQFAYKPLDFRLNELPAAKRVWRKMHGGYFERACVIGAFYCGFLIHTSAEDAHFRKMQWSNESWNYDFAFTRYNRDKGGFHGVV